jgi:hypothetical protein
MNKDRKILMIITASLALAFAGCTGGRNSPGAGAAPAADTAQATLTTVMQEYHTAASRHLASLEADFNQTLPSGASPIVYVDYDVIATWFGMREGPATVEGAIGDYLLANTGHSYGAPTLSQLAKAMNSLPWPPRLTRAAHSSYDLMSHSINFSKRMVLPWISVDVKY